jgi:hypothetical protein
MRGFILYFTECKQDEQSGADTSSEMEEQGEEKPEKNEVEDI